MRANTRELIGAALAGGVVAGTIDIAAACLINGHNIRSVLHAIAGGLLGEQAFAGGMRTVILGAALQEAMAVVIAAVFVAATLMVPALRRRWIAAGVAYGVVIFFVMNYVVVPLSAWHVWPHFSVARFCSNLLAMLVFGSIVAYFASRAWAHTQWLRNNGEPDDEGAWLDGIFRDCSGRAAVFSTRPDLGPVRRSPDSGPRDGDPGAARRAARFRFRAGHWKIHLKTLVHPLTGSHEWVEFDGTSVTAKVWDGKAEIEQFETDSAVSGHIEGLTLRLYNPASDQWSLYWASSRTGTLAIPTVGGFKDGRGEFYDQEEIDGRVILVRFVWTGTETNSPHFEQSFSDDGGKTWEVNWITDQTRVAEADFHPQMPAVAEQAGQHDFDFFFGNWKYHLKRLVHPLTGSRTWVEADGNAVVHKVWGGRADLSETLADRGSGRIVGLTLRTFNPKTHQWYLYWANSRDGVIAVPQIGEFKNGIGEFYAQDTLDDRAILVRFVWTGTTSKVVHFEQSFSADGGKSWEVNWISESSH